jgi:methylmalonyl-CoA mutase N-terminal domain/subunit
LSNNKKQWLKEVYEKAKNKFSERKSLFAISSGSKVEPIYGPEDLASWQYHEKLGYPGEYPFTRGTQSTMYRGRLWTMRQYAGFGDASESNERFKYLLSQGQNGLSVAFDLPTQIGYDSDDKIVEGEVGKVGVAISSLADMEALTKDLPLDQVTTSMTINATGGMLLALYVAAAKKQGVSLEKIGGTIQNDILKEYIARGTYIFPPDQSLRLLTDQMSWCFKNAPRFNTISISGYHMREAGCTASQEVAFTLANAIQYSDAAIAAGLKFDEFASQFSFFWACHSIFFEEVAKFRAAKRIWAKIAKERYKSQSPRAQMLRFHTQTGGATLTAQQVDNNVVRTAYQGLSAVLGGTQSLHTNSKDEALAIPTEESAQLALRTQQVLAYETGIADVIDPLAGSYYIESLTDRLEEEINAYLNKIDDMGGALAGIAQGYQQREIQESAYIMQKQIEEKSKIVVGVNDFINENDPPVKVFRVDPSIGKKRIQQMTKFRGSRDMNTVTKSLNQLKKAAVSSDNLMPYLIDAFESYATIGEVCSVLRDEWGEYKENVTL